MRGGPLVLGVWVELPLAWWVREGSLLVLERSRWLLVSQSSPEEMQNVAFAPGQFSAKGSEAKGPSQSPVCEG